MDCQILSSNTILAVGVSIGLGVGSTGGGILGWTGQSFSSVVVPASVEETVTPLYKDLKDIAAKIEDLKKMPGAAAAIGATNATAKTALPDITRMESLFVACVNSITFQLHSH